MDGSIRILDVQEKEVGAVRQPSFPTPRAASTGFPQPRKRSAFASSFKQQRQRAAAADGRHQATTIEAPVVGAKSAAGDSLEKTTIDRENRERLRSMDADEIAEARQELLTNLDPSLLQILLRRANLDEAGSAPVLPGDEPTLAPAAVNDTTKSEEEEEEKDSGTELEEEQEKTTTDTSRRLTGKSVRFASVEDDKEDEPPFVLPTDLAPITESHNNRHDHNHDHDHDHHDHPHGNATASAPMMHFPHAPTVPDLDPADPDFLQNLHAKYFPSLPADPARLAWMAPLPTADSPADRESPYYPGQDSIAVSQLRFDFRGRLVPPRVSRTIPVSKGLHHHGVAPEAAGYTVAELARLARSAVPAQRCVAFQTLGRILYRLGRGEWGTAGDSSSSGGGGDSNDNNNNNHSSGNPLMQGIWQSMREGRVLDTLREAASVEEGRGHRGSRAYAVEAIWLFEKGGFREQWRGR